MHEAIIRFRQLSNETTDKNAAATLVLASFIKDLVEATKQLIDTVETLKKDLPQGMI